MEWSDAVALSGEVAWSQLGTGIGHDKSKPYDIPVEKGVEPLAMKATSGRSGSTMRASRCFEANLTEHHQAMESPNSEATSRRGEAKWNTETERGVQAFRSAHSG